MQAVQVISAIFSLSTAPFRCFSTVNAGIMWSWPFTSRVKNSRNFTCYLPIAFYDVLQNMGISFQEYAIVSTIGFKALSTSMTKPTCINANNYVAWFNLINSCHNKQ